MTATNDPKFKSDNPMMACPDVQPFAQRVPKPTKNPPRTINIQPMGEEKEAKENIFSGIYILDSFETSEEQLKLPS